MGQGLLVIFRRGSVWKQGHFCLCCPWCCVCVCGGGVLVRKLLVSAADVTASCTGEMSLQRSRPWLSVHVAAAGCREDILIILTANIDLAKQLPGAGGNSTCSEQQQRRSRKA